MVVMPVILSASFGVADMLPVGGLVTGAGKALFFDKGFKQADGVIIVILPV